SSVALCTDGASVTSIAFFNNPLSSPFLRVTFRQRTKFGQIFITPNSGRTFFITFNAKQSYPKRTILNGYP
ncbi:hypothetical protein KZY67_05540, partial [Prevotella melaninogenica]